MLTKGSSAPKALLLEAAGFEEPPRFENKADGFIACPPPIAAKGSDGAAIDANGSADAAAVFTG